MTNVYDIIIVGGGFAGISAGIRAKKHGLSCIILEAQPHILSALHKYQKGKLVTDFPADIANDSGVEFTAGSRDTVLNSFLAQVEDAGLNIHLNTSIKQLSVQKSLFEIILNDGKKIHGKHTILAFGDQSNLKTLDIPGGSSELVQYQLDDPDAYTGETIAVIGAGDTGIENALALMDRNNVIIINRRDGIDRPSELNRLRLEKALRNEHLTCLNRTKPVKIEGNALYISGSDGDDCIPCDRIIARLGAMPPRGLLEQFGVTFSSGDNDARPNLNSSLEAAVPNLFVAGTLTGYPLIKHALNQGAKIVDQIAGVAKESLEEIQLQSVLQPLLNGASVEEYIANIKEQVSLFSSFTPLQVREFILDCTISTPEPDELIFETGEYTRSFFIILNGSSWLRLEEGQVGASFEYGAGDWMGEVSLICNKTRFGHMYAGKGPNALLEVSRDTYVKWSANSSTFKQEIEMTSAKRCIRIFLLPDMPNEMFEQLTEKAKFKKFSPGEALFETGDSFDGVHLICKGAVAVSRTIGGREITVDYAHAGDYRGEISHVKGTNRGATARAASEAETMLIAPDDFQALLDCSENFRREVERRILQSATIASRKTDAKDASGILEFFVSQQIGDAMDMLVIDTHKCVSCDFCETACSATHNGTSRLDRSAGALVEHLKLPISCRHCDHPQCMSDCPPGAIHRTLEGEVYIDETCIGCGNCQENCPYDVIQLVDDNTNMSSSILRTIFGLPTESKKSGDQVRQVAVKCDMCRELNGGPACVRACPTGAAQRLTPDQLFSMASS